MIEPLLDQGRTKVLLAARTPGKARKRPEVRIDELIEHLLLVQVLGERRAPDGDEMLVVEARFPGELGRVSRIRLMQLATMASVSATSATMRITRARLRRRERKIGPNSMTVSFRPYWFLRCRAGGIAQIRQAG